MIVTTSYFDSLVSSVLTEHVASGGFSGPMFNLSALLFQNNFLPRKSTLFADLTEATYSGYARQAAVTWGLPIQQADGSYTILSQLLTFIAGASSNFVANTIWGWALFDNVAGQNLVMMEVFQQPLTLAAPGQGFGLAVEYNQTPSNLLSFGSILA